MLYEVTTDCLDLSHRYRKKGERVVVPDGVPVPKWFKPIGEVKTNEVKDIKQEYPREEYKTLNQMKKDELLELAGKEGVYVPIGATNQEIIRLIRSDRKRRKATL